MDHQAIEFITWLLILVATTCMQHFNFIEAARGTYEYAGYKLYSAENELYGVHGKLNIWSPHTNIGDFSATVVTVGLTNLGIELSAGWIVKPDVFHGTIPTIFASYKIQSKICYSFIFKHDCTGFVGILPSFPYVPYSVINGTQHEIDVIIVQDNETKDWRLIIDDVDYGFWTGLLASRLEGGANIVGWGGVVYKSNNVSQIPTAMGSGKYPEEGYRYASYIRHVEYIDKNYTFMNPHTNNLQPFGNVDARYKMSQIIHQTNDNNSTSFYYGGAGYLPNVI